jgi:hypothetical protein
LDPAGFIPNLSSVTPEFRSLDAEQLCQCVSDCNSDRSSGACVPERLPFSVTQLNLDHICTRFMAKRDPSDGPGIGDAIAEPVSRFAAKLLMSARVSEDVRKVTVRLAGLSPTAAEAHGIVRSIDALRMVVNPALGRRSKSSEYRIR